jgi:hypothetical protein
VRSLPRRTAKIPSLPCVFPWRTAKGVACRFIPAPSVAFFAVCREKTHDKDHLPCVVRCGARQRGFTVQNATMCPLPCAPTRNAWQRVCRAPRRKTHGKEFVVRFRAFAVAHGKAAVSRCE